MTRELETASSSRELIEEGSRILAEAGIDTARLDAEVLLAYASGSSRASMVTGTGPLSGKAIHGFRAMVQRRASREPIAYIVGRKEFFSLDFEVNRAVLIPRPETEALVDEALKFVAIRPRARILDIGTGSGAIAIAVAVNAPTAQVVATDISKAALEVARRNAVTNRCEDRIEFIEADVFPDRESPFDLILSNPPYVAEGVLPTLEPEIREYEPREALTDGDDGLAFYRRIANQSPKLLKSGGAVMVEIGAGQRLAIEALFRRAGFSNIDAVADLARIDRVVIAKS
jgi:release factor glutamine methyltransferase